MFFKEKITAIKKNYRVLEVGPGGSPYPRSDVYLEKNFSNEEEKIAQKGFSLNEIDENKIVYYNGGKFPFKDKEFDYVICSHVLEHVPESDLPLFISELERVAERGYIEFPNVFYELINFQPVHLWFMNYRNNEILFLNKEKFKSNFIHQSIREMFYGIDRYASNIIRRYREFFFVGFEWNHKIDYKIVEDWDQLISENDFNKTKLYFSCFKEKNRKKELFYKYIGYIVYLKNIFLKKMSRNNYSIDKTATIEGKKFISFGENSQIKKYVIIRTDNYVKIGENVQINPFTVIYGGGGIIIGNNVIIAPHCMIAAGNHDYKQTEKPIRFADTKSKGPIVIEDDAWIGANCTITDGVRIGKGAVIGANSLVNKNVPPYEVFGGVPAKYLLKRNI